MADSGTVEEIEQFIAAGKPVMMYFSKRPIDPNLIDNRQSKKLKAFKAETYQTAYCADFSSITELKTELNKHLTNTVRRLQKDSQLQAELEPADEAATENAQHERKAFEVKVLQDRFRTFKARRDALAMSLVPAMPLKKSIDFGQVQETSLLQIINPVRSDYGVVEHYGQSAYCFFPPFRGLPNEKQSPQCATELTHRGVIYVVDNWMYMDQDDHEPKYRMEVYQPAIISAVQRYLSGLRTLGIEGIIFLGISMLKAGKFKFVPHREYNSFNDGLLRGSSGEDIVMETIAVGSDADISTFERTAAIIQPALLHLWREVGFRSVPKYDAYGNFLGW